MAAPLCPDPSLQLRRDFGPSPDPVFQLLFHHCQPGNAELFISQNVFVVTPQEAVMTIPEHPDNIIWYKKLRGQSPGEGEALE